MKYKVFLSYYGSLTVEVEADNEQKALEAARANVGAMSDTDFNNAINLMEDEHDVEAVVAGPFDGWKKPRFTADDVLKGAHYEEVPYLKDINDSMELDSGGEDLAYLKNTIFTRSGKKITANASVRVQGDVRVRFKGQWYRSASSMPKELIECYHDGSDPAMLDPDYYVDNNNWFEEFVKVTDEDGIDICDVSIVIDDVTDMKEGLADSLVEILNDDEECIGMLFKEDDHVRWNDPDESLDDQLNPDELLEYRQRTFRIFRKEDDFANISDIYSEAQVPYSELLLKEA